MNERELESVFHHGGTRGVPFDLLMPSRVQSILLVSSLYDSFTLKEHGDLSESLLSEFLALDMRGAPRVVRVSTAEQALRRLESDNYQLVITTLRVGKMSLSAFRQAIDARRPGLPVLVLAYNERDLARLSPRYWRFELDRPYIWLGDVGLMLAMIKYVEDRLNVRHDTWLADVQSVILVEDSVRFYSAFMPMLYRELVAQNKRALADGLNREQRLLRRRVRPKVLLTTSFDEALELYQRYESNVLGIITDVRYRRGSRVSPDSGIALARLAKEHNPDLPVLVMSSNADNGPRAWELGASFAHKRSPDLLQQVRSFLLANLGFGDFVFRLPSGHPVAEAHDLKGFVACLRNIPDASLLYHAAKNHLSTWLMARSEVELARSLRPQKAEDFESAAGLRAHLIEQIDATRRARRRGVVADFSVDSFDADSGFVRAHEGSMGGKGRGLAFVHTLIDAPQVRDQFPGVKIFVPPTTVLGTSAFDEFIVGNGLKALAFGNASDAEITAGFLDKPLPRSVIDVLDAIVRNLRYPLAVRSSSLLEDAYFQPFAGVYHTFMLANSHPDIEVRRRELEDAVKRVYASTFFADAKAYMQGTTWRIEEEKMAVAIQQLVGRKHGDHFYPDVSGVARSVDFYPMPSTRPEDGVACLALGLGRTVAEGRRCVRFSPAEPRRLYQFHSTRATLDSAQRRFYALSLNDTLGAADVVSLQLEDAKTHGTLRAVASTYSPNNDRITPGVGRQGIPLVTMSGVLGGRIIALPEVIQFLLKLAHTGLNGPAEIEFAVNLGDGTEDNPHQVGFLQIRPIVLGSNDGGGSVSEVLDQEAVVKSDKALGHGREVDIRDVVYLPPQTFDRAKTPEIAHQVGRINARLRDRQRPYVLIGPGRWGSKDRWLGVPVGWSQINGARCIVETDMADIPVTPSQGSHFFQNMTSLGISYFTVNFGGAGGHVDYDWLDALEATEQTEYVRHVTLDDPLEVFVDARLHHGVVLKPGRSLAPG